MANLVITSVGYRRLKNLGNYENHSLEATAQVAAGEDPEAVRQTLVEWIEERIDPLKKMSELDREICALKEEWEAVKKALEKAGQRWAKAKVVLKRHGLETSDIDPFIQASTTEQDLPF